MHTTGLFVETSCSPLPPPMSRSGSSRPSSTISSPNHNIKALTPKNSSGGNGAGLDRTYALRKLYDNSSYADRVIEIIDVNRSCLITSEGPIVLPQQTEPRQKRTRFNVVKAILAVESQHFSNLFYGSGMATRGESCHT